MNRSLNLTMCKYVDGIDGIPSYRNTYKKIVEHYKDDGKSMLHAFALYYEKICAARTNYLAGYPTENALFVDSVCAAYKEDITTVNQLGQDKRDMFI